ncbi:unnamed protein product [Periconia digitata]|uniref:Ankyrin n=1 Tax=Periconia digitata TaxID=1303443 RepID=A0A9W4UN06_9PLEO|nr:unnamed protein product [Periconia digitata]
MKTFLCLTSRAQDEPDEYHNIPVNLLKDDDATTAVNIERINKSTKLQKLLQVIRCELERPKESIATSALSPTKQWTPLYYSVYHNRTAALQHFLHAGHSPNGLVDLGQPPLCIATAAGHLDVVTLLCEADADINAAVRYTGEMALHIAINAGRSDLTDVLLSCNPNLNAKTLQSRETPLHYAAAKAGSLATVVSLIKRGADVEALNAKGCSPAEVALQSKNLNAAVAIVSAARGSRRILAKEKELLLKHVEKAQNRFSMNNELIGDIFEAGCPPDSTVLIEAIKRNDSGLVEMFLEKGADPNRSSASGLLPIFAALACSGSQIMHTLIKHKADVTLKDQSGHTVLQGVFESVLAHDREVVSKLFQMLLSNGADPLARYSDGSTLLHHAVVEGSGIAKIVQQLLQHGVKIDEQDFQGNTALHMAFRNRLCISVLIKHGSNTELLNKEGLTALLHATKYATRDKEPDFEPLVKASNISTTDPTGMTSLHFASQNGLERAVRALLHARSDTSAVDSRKRTPLLLAVCHQQWHIVPLFASQPGVNAWNEEGLTALHLIAMSTPNSPSSWKDIASATAPFCEKGVSRTLREKSGATPLILAVKSLPEDGLPVVEALLSRKGSERSNCVGHQDLQQHDALYYAATLCKPSFVLALLKNGSPFALKDWLPSNKLVDADNAVGKQVLKIMAEHEWLHRALSLQRQSFGDSSGSALPSILPIDDLRLLLTMGLNPNSPPKSKFTSPLLWTVLNQVQPSLPTEYLSDVLKVLFTFGADANVIATRNMPRNSLNEGTQSTGLTIHPLTYLLERSQTVEISLIQLFLDNGAKLSIASTFFKGRHPLHTAVQIKQIDIIKLFLKNNANVNSKDANGLTPLHTSILQNNPETTDMLLHAGAQIDTKDNAGNTPLHIAALHSNASLITTLLHRGASASALNSHGKTPLDLLPPSPNNPDAQRISSLLTYAQEDERRSMSTSTITSSSQPLSTTPPSSITTSSTAPAPPPTTRRKKSFVRPPPTPMTPHQLLSTSAKVPPHLLRNQSNPSIDLDEPQQPKPETATPVRLSKQVVSIRYTPPTPDPHARLASPLPSSSPDQNPVVVREEKRVDSSVHLALVQGEEGKVAVVRGEDEAENKKQKKEFPILDRKCTSFDRKDEVGGKMGKQVENRGDGHGEGDGDELASWLAVSGALERL